MNHKLLSLGFIGGGWNSAVGTTHFVAARMDGLFSVDAGAFSRNPETNRQTGLRWDLDDQRVYASVQEMLAHEAQRLDAVVVLTPTPDHPDHVFQALEAGVPVICEKALAATVEAGVQIAREVARTGGYLALTFNYTGYPMVRELRRLMRDGRLGRITQVHVEMPQEGFAKLGPDGGPLKPQPWRLQDGPIPTISLDLGVHVHHLVQFLTGEAPIEFLATHSTHGNFDEVVDNVTCLARFTGEIDCTYWFSKSALGHRNGLRIRVYGTRGSAEWFQMDPETLVLHDAHGGRSILDRAGLDSQVASAPRYTRFKAGHPAGFIEAFANLYEDIARTLVARQAEETTTSEFVFDAVDAVDGLLALEAMTASTRNRSWTPPRTRAEVGLA